MSNTNHGDQPARQHHVQMAGVNEQSYGRLFPHLPPAYYPPDRLDAASLLMRMPDDKADEAAGRWNTPAQPQGPTAAENDRIAAAHTYFGQFVDHDLTFELGTRLGRADPGVGPVNFRTPRMDLDSVYGRGPDSDPYLYEEDAATLRLPGDDLPRVANSTAIVPDPRNDENSLVAQVHIAVIKLHNGLVAAGLSFDEAQRLTRWHYQWVVLHDFVPTLCGEAVYGDVLHGRGVRLLPWPYGQFMPVEFSGAAYRFGHSQVRSDYVIAAGKAARPIFGQPGEDLRGHQPIDDSRRVDWSLLVDPSVTPTFKIDTELAPALFKLFGDDDPAKDPPDLPPGIGANLAARNLRRGVVLGLPSGENVLTDLISRDILSESDYDSVEAESIDAVAATIRNTFWKTVENAPGSTPLWGWVLAEAEVVRSGHSLGPVGARIVADTLVGLLQADPRSFLRAAPGWTPSATQYGLRNLLGVG